MTNDKPKREDAPIAWRVSDNTIECVLDDTNPWESNPHINQLLKSRRKFALDLKDAHTTLGVLQGEVSRCSDFAATLGHENDALREREKDCEACGGKGLVSGSCDGHGRSCGKVTCDACSGTGQTLRRESEEG